LLGGFATPALLSTGENRPIPLFAYLLLLNVGLAYVAYTKRWPALTGLTLVFTAVYQWGWVLKFLDASSVPLAMGIFLLFPIAAVAGLMLAGRTRAGGSEPIGQQFERPALASAAMPLLFACFLAAVPAYGARPSLLFGFLFLIDAGLLAIALARRQEVLHAVGAVATMLVPATWIANSYREGDGYTAVGFTALFSVFYVAAPIVASRLARPFSGAAVQAQYAGPLLLASFPVLAVIEPLFVHPWLLMGTLLGLVIVIACRAVVARTGALYFVAAFFAIATQAVWSALHLTVDRLGTAVAIYVAFGLVSLGAPLVARRVQRPLQPAWGGGVVLLLGLCLLFFLSLGPVAPAALWALALLLAIANAALFVESAAGRLPTVSQIGSLLSWVVLMTWWARAAGSVGVLPSLLVVVGLTLVTLVGHGWAVRSTEGEAPGVQAPFTRGLYLGLIGHLFLGLLALDRTWSLPPWPVFAALAAITLGTSAAALWSRVATMHVAGTIAAALVVTAWSATAGSPAWGLTAAIAGAAVSGYAFLWMPLAARFHGGAHVAYAAGATLFVGELSLIAAVEGGAMPAFPLLLAAHVVNLSALLALTTHYRWPFVAVGAVVPAWVAVLQWQSRRDLGTAWPELLALSATLYAVFAAYPFVVGRRARDSRDPYLAAVLASAMAFFGARAAFVAGGLDWMIGVIPVLEGAVLAAMLRSLLGLEPAGQRDLGRLALVAGAALAFVTVAIPLQLEHQWITIGWAVEGAALAWVYTRIRHRGLLYTAVALLGTVFVRLALNPDIFSYEPRGTMRILNWYLYTYLLCAAAMLMAGRFLAKTDDRLGLNVRSSAVLPAAGVVLLFLLLNIEITDFYAAGPTTMFRFGVTVAQDLTYTIGWLVFGMGLLAAGIWLGHQPARIAAVTLIAVTTFKCFLYDLGSLEGLPRVASFVGLAISLALVSLALQKYVLKTRNAAT
jgi:uncharacterized membrane protein